MCVRKMFLSDHLKFSKSERLTKKSGNLILGSIPRSLQINTEADKQSRRKRIMKLVPCMHSLPRLKVVVAQVGQVIPSRYTNRY